MKLRIKSGSVVLNVADTGCGIAEADCPYIFERFYRMNKARTRAAAAAGALMSVCPTGWKIWRRTI